MVTAGFFGKIPTRGDFVRHGLPGDLVRALDDWWQVVLSGSQARLGTAWTDIWMEAPIWRFLLPPGVCGTGAVAGLWLPSTDKAGRLFPLTLAVTAPSWQALSETGSFLDAAEAAGLVAVEQDVTPEQLAAALERALAQASGSVGPVQLPTWWTEGSALVAAGRRTTLAMPDTATFTSMLRES